MKRKISYSGKFFAILISILAILVIAACATTASPTPSPTSSPQSPLSTPRTETINLIAQNMAFNMSTVTVPAGAVVIVNFNNKDTVPHNFAVYQSGSGSTGTANGTLFQGQIISGPGTATYTFTAPTTPGNYFFRCDVHPTIMFGTFVVTP